MSEDWNPPENGCPRCFTEDQHFIDTCVGVDCPFESKKTIWKDMDVRKFDPYHFKQMLVVRKDLNMRKGKIGAQCGHASLASFLKYPDDPRMLAWLDGPFAKICVSVDSEEEFDEAVRAAEEAGIMTTVIIDQGRTEFNGVPTKTVVAIGPDTHENLEPITGKDKMKLL
jgi:PTH2 family peptidyl-tRNA hydrolase